MLRTWRAGVAVLGAALCLCTAQAGAAEAISAAETLLFQTDHLRQLRTPARLSYVYKKAGTAEPGFEDHVYLDVAAVKPDGSAQLTMDFLSGSRKRPTPDADNPRGNPVLLGFLERDIAEMKRLAGGAPNYFRKRIRLALAERAQVRSIGFTYGGKAFTGQEVSIEPYRDDPLHARFEKYVGKRYVFVLSEQVPGRVYQLRTTLEPAVMEETLTLVKDEGRTR